MIYIIIGRETATGNEWVEEDTFDTAADTAERCNILRTFPETKEITYRIETVEPSEGKTPARLYADKEVETREAQFRQGVKEQLNAEFGKAKMDHEEQHYAYRDTDSGRFEATEANGDFTTKELFGNQTGYVIPGAGRVYLCAECGSIIHGVEKHAAWHNKLLP